MEILSSFQPGIFFPDYEQKVCNKNAWSASIAIFASIKIRFSVNTKELSILSKGIWLKVRQLKEYMQLTLITLILKESKSVQSTLTLSLYPALFASPLIEPLNSIDFPFWYFELAVS